MSSINAAKKRRANIVQPVSEPQPQTQQQAPNRNLMSLPQVLKVFDTRLNAIESNVNELKSSSTTTDASDSKESSISIATEMQEILGEYEERFQVLANEIQSMKEIVLKLQSYTMDVNKTLLEERVQIMSSSTTANETIEMTEAPKTSTPEVLSNEEDELNLDESNLGENENTQNEPQTEEEFSVAINNHKKKKKKGGH